MKSKLTVRRKPMKNRSQLFLIYTAAFLLCAAGVYACFIVKGRSLVVSGDGWKQHFTAFVYFGQYGRTALRTLLTEHQLVLPQWNFSLGYGGDILTTLHYYVIGDPLDLLSIACPTRYAVYLYSFLSLFRLYLAGLGFGAFCRYKKQGAPLPVAVGSVCYVFFTYSFLMVARHPFFALPMVYLPLLLLGVEQVLAKRRPYLLIVTVFLAAVSNFYFFYMLAIITAIYTVYRLCCLYDRHSAKQAMSGLLQVTLWAVVGALMSAAMTEAEGRIAKSTNGVTGIPTGLTDLDRMTSGLQNGELVVIAARPGVGKTAFALHMARSAAMAGYAVAVYSLEMQGERLADRWLTAVSEISARHWRSGTVSQQELVEARTTAADLKRLPIHVDDSTSVNMEHIRSSARLLQSQHACDAIIIDYLQLCDMTTGQNNRNREQEVAQATRKAKLLAKELNVPVVLLSQLNRESENRPAGRPELAHLRESGAIEQDADVVMLLYRPALARVTTDRESGYPTEGLGVVIIAKQRNGETGNVYFRHNPEMTKITEYVPPLEYMLKHAK